MLVLMAVTLILLKEELVSRLVQVIIVLLLANSRVVAVAQEDFQTSQPLTAMLVQQVL
jgi:hypothetical protein